MKTIRIPNVYTFEYDTRLTQNKLVTYHAWSLSEALSKLKKNTKYTKILEVLENGKLLRNMGVYFS